MQVKKKARLYINGCSYIGGLYESNSPVSTPDDCSNYPLSNIFENAVCNPRLDTHSVDAGHGGDNNDSIFRRTMIDCSKHKFDYVGHTQQGGRQMISHQIGKTMKIT